MILLTQLMEHIQSSQTILLSFYYSSDTTETESCTITTLVHTAFTTHVAIGDKQHDNNPASSLLSRFSPPPRMIQSLKSVKEIRTELQQVISMVGEKHIQKALEVWQKQ